jgi:hypothetical protein
MNHLLKKVDQLKVKNWMKNFKKLRLLVLDQLQVELKNKKLFKLKQNQQLEDQIENQNSLMN